MPPPPMPPQQDMGSGGMNDPAIGAQMDGMTPPSPMDDMGGMGEEESPKKDIQSKTGALSQALNQYNQEQVEPDTELNKYVLGMLIPQASKGMTGKDKQDIINKLNGNEEDTEDGGNDNQQMSNEPMDMGNQQMPMESRKRNIDIVNEVMQDILGKRGNDDNRKRGQKTNTLAKNKNFDKPNPWWR